MAKAKVKIKKKAASKSKGKPVAKNITKPIKKIRVKQAGKKAVKQKPAVKKKITANVKTKVVNKKSPKIASKAKVITRSVAGRLKPDTNNNIAKQPYKTKMNKTEPVKKELNHRYSNEELKEFKEIIDRKMNAAREELKNLKESLDSDTQSQADNKAGLDEGTETSEMEYLMNQVSRQHGYIRNLELALARIMNKTYGICRVTGKLIPKERLRIVPHATLSLEAKMTRKADNTGPDASIAELPSDISEGFED